MQQTGTSRNAKCVVHGWMFLAMALLLMLSSPAAFAQYDTGSLVGTIHDASGAVVPNVTVTVTNIATGVATVVKTGAAGIMKFRSCAWAFTTSPPAPLVSP